MTQPLLRLAFFIVSKRLLQYIDSFATGIDKIPYFNNITVNDRILLVGIENGLSRRPIFMSSGDSGRVGWWVKTERKRPSES